MFPYYLLLGASLAGGPFLARRPEYRRGYLSVMGLACWLTASMRYVTGFDYRFYESAFQSVAALGLNGAGWSEPGYLLLNWAVSFFSSDYRVFLLVFHLLLTILVFVWIGRCSPSPWLSVFLFISLQYFALSMNFLRQALAAAIADITGAEAKYLGAPNFAYQVDYFTIDRSGAVTFDDRADSEEVENLIERLASMGFEAQIPAPDRKAEELPAGGAESEPAPDSAAQEGNTLTIQMPTASFTPEALNNLHSLIAAKGRLIRKALGADLLPVQVEADTVSFPWFSGELTSEEVKAYTHLITALCDMARNQKRITAKEKETDNDKYAFRCFLLRLGFIGAEYKTERKILLRNLTGNGAFKARARREASSDVVSE